MTGGVERPLVAVIMGSDSDWETMQKAITALDDFDIEWDCRVLSAHRTPDLVWEYARNAEANGLRAIIAGAGGAAHLPGIIAALTPLPVLGVPIESKALKGLDSLLSIVQMPSGVPVATFSIGPAGAMNAALFVVRILALESLEINARYHAFMQALVTDVENKQLALDQILAKRNEGEKA